MVKSNALDLMPNLGIDQFSDDCIKDVKKILTQAQTQGYRAVNTVMIQHIGWLGPELCMKSIKSYQINVGACRDTRLH